MSIAFVEYPAPPDSLYEMWDRGELEAWLNLPPGFRAEIIEGDIVVSPAPRFAPNAIATRSAAAFRRKRNGNRVKTKWTDYASAGVEYYLLIDRDPRVVRATLYFDPNPDTSRYESAVAWKFGEPIVLPEPFGVTIDTADWKAWPASKP